MKTNYSITLSAKNADNTKSIIASLSDNEMTAIQEVNRANYSIEIHRNNKGQFMLFYSSS